MFLYLQHIHLYIQYTKGPKNQILCVRISLEMADFGISGTFGGAVARHGLILWENDATGSTNLLK